MPPAQPNHSLLLELQGKLSADLFARAAPLRLAADEALFLAGDGGAVVIWSKRDCSKWL
jgi:hypothetical protein